jgi:hypothetical protein
MLRFIPAVATPPLPTHLCYHVGKMVLLGAMNLLLYSFGLFSLGLCQYKLKDQTADPRSHLRLPPKLGLGTWFLDISVKNTTEAVAGAIAQGYRHIDGRIQLLPSEYQI